MTTLAVACSALALYTGILLAADSWRRTSARWVEDLPLLLDNAHEWQSVPGSAVDRCLDCPATRVRRWTT